MPPAFSILIALGLLSLLMMAATWAQSLGKICAESARKLVHIGMGCICLSFPYLFDSVLPVQILGACAVFALSVIKISKLRASIGASLFSVNRISVGELLFPTAVAWLFTLSWDKPLLYCISLLLLTVADSIGAIAGSKLGKKIYQTFGARKSIEGSIAFFIAAFFCVAVPLYFFTLSPDGKLSVHLLPLTHIILLSLTIALFSTAVEGASGHGLDNLLIPIGSFLLLDYYLELSASQLLVRALALIVLLATLLMSHKKHTLSGGAILIALLYSFAAFTLGGAPCFLATLIIFIRHIWVQKKFKDKDIIVHSLDAILAISLPSLFWLTLGRGDIISHVEAQYGFITTLAIIIFMLNTSTQKHLGAMKPNMFIGILLSSATLSPLGFVSISLLQFISTVFISGSFAWLYFYWKRADRNFIPLQWLKLSFLAFLGSLLNMFITRL